MRRVTLVLAVALLVTACVVRVAPAQSPAPEQLRAKAQQLRQQLETLKSQGKEDAAREVAKQLEALMRQAAQLHARAEQQRPKAGEEGADPRRQMAEKMEAMKRQMQELAKAGKKEEAQQVERQLRQMMEHLKQHAAGRPGPRAGHPPTDQMRRQMGEKMEAMKRQMQELAKAGKNEEAQQVERQLHQMMEHMKQQSAGRAPQPHSEQHAQQRLKLVAEAVHHLQQGAAKLQAAGLAEPAQHVRQVAERIGQEVGKQTQAHQAQQAIGKLHEEVIRLRKEVDQLKAGR